MCYSSITPFLLFFPFSLHLSASLCCLCFHILICDMSFPAQNDRYILRRVLSLYAIRLWSKKQEFLVPESFHLLSEKRRHQPYLWWHHCNWNIFAFWTSQNSSDDHLIASHFLSTLLGIAWSLHLIWSWFKNNQMNILKEFLKIQWLFPAHLRHTCTSIVINTLCIIFSTPHKDSEQELRLRTLWAKKLTRSHTDLSWCWKGFYVQLLGSAYYPVLSTHWYLPDFNTYPS